MPRSKAEQYSTSIWRSLCVLVDEAERPEIFARLSSRITSPVQLRRAAATLRLISTIRSVLAQFEHPLTAEADRELRLRLYSVWLSPVGLEFIAARHALPADVGCEPNRGGRPAKRSLSDEDGQLIDDVKDVIKRRKLAERSACQALVSKNRDYQGQSAEVLRKRYRRALALPPATPAPRFTSQK